MAYRLQKAEKNYGVQQTIEVLDPIKKTLSSWFLKRGMRMLSLSLNEAEFYAGHLRDRTGKNIWKASEDLLSPIAIEVAKRTINKNKSLAELNKKWGKDTLLLFLSKYYQRTAGSGGAHTIFKILIAEALSKDKLNNSHLILSIPEGYTIDLLKSISKSIKIHIYNSSSISIRTTRLSVFLLIVFVRIKQFLYGLKSVVSSKVELGNENIPAVLLSREDDLSIDRSYRGQPHWIFGKKEIPKFRTLILSSEVNNDNKVKLNNHEIYTIPKEMLYRKFKKGKINRDINKSLFTLLVLSISNPKEIRNLTFELAVLFLKSSMLAGFCKSNNVKGFMTCENYFLDALAMNLIGQSIDIHTFSYQYANISKVKPVMMTNADTMFTFSSHFHNRWSEEGIKPKKFIDIGYLYDSSFGLIKGRVNKIKKSLKKNKVKTVIAYFDENIKDKNDKYGTYHADDLYNEILPLIKLVNKDNSIAIISKSQFLKNTPSILFKNKPEINKAIKTGRWVELYHGNFRNNIFPAEAAMIADIAIAHLVGATAALETVLAGTRCLLIDPHDMGHSSTELFKRANIMYRDMDSALNAILSYNQGIPEYKNLGDWSPIVDIFDPFQDGQSASRLYSVIEEVILS